METGRRWSCATTTRASAATWCSSKQGDWPQGKAIGIERLASQFLKIGVGDHVLIRYNNTEHDYPIGGLIRHPFVPPPDFGGPPYFFADAEQMERFGVPSGKFSSLLIRVTPYSEAHAKEVAAAIKDRLAKQGIGVGGDALSGPRQTLGPHVRRRHDAGHAGAGRAFRCS